MEDGRSRIEDAIVDGSWSGWVTPGSILDRTRIPPAPGGRFGTGLSHESSACHSEVCLRPLVADFGGHAQDDNGPIPPPYVMLSDLRSFVQRESAPEAHPRLRIDVHAPVDRRLRRR